MPPGRALALQIRQELIGEVHGHAVSPRLHDLTHLVFSRHTPCSDDEPLSMETVARLTEWTVAADVVHAMKLLATHPKIDRRRIATIGFSKGGNAALFSAFAAVQEAVAGPEQRLAVHIPLYPSCNTFYLNMPTTRAPIVFLLGEKDDLTPASECVAYATYLRARGADTQTIVYPGVYHGFDISGLRQSRNIHSQNWGQCFRAYDPTTRTMTRRDIGQTFDPGKKDEAAYLRECIT